MRKLGLTIGLIGLALLGTVGSAQKPNQPDVVAQLLALPAPRPTNPHQPKPASLADYDEKHAPPDKAPIEELELYWSTGGPHPDKAKMSAQVRERFLAYGEQHRDKLPFLLEQELLPTSPDTPARIKAAMDAGLTSYYGQTSETQIKQYEESWQRKLRDWLTLHSNFYLDELEQRARTAQDENGAINAEAYVQAFAKLNWARALPVLENYLYSPHPRTATLALRLLYEHAVANNADAATWRTRLQQVVADKDAPGKARDLACDALMKTKWEGRDEWFLSLFADNSLRTMEDGRSGAIYPLNQPVLADPEHWIPLLAKLVGHSNPAIHEAAVDCLASFDPTTPRKEALQPLVPWLTNPKWSAATGRKELLQALAKVSLPEAVPGLIWVVENDEDSELCAYAAEALTTYRSRSAAPALKRLLARPLSPTERKVAIDALVACGGLSVEEMVKAIEAYAGNVVAHGKGDPHEKIINLKELDFDDNAPLQISIGKVLSESARPHEEVASRLFERIQTLEKAQPATARSLLTIVQQWDLRIVHAHLVQRLAAGKSDVNELQFALKIRARLRQSAGDELQALAVKNNAPAGLAAALLEDEFLPAKILSDDGKEAKRALLAAARLVRAALPLAQVGELLNDAQLKPAAERYLASEDSPEARRLLLAHHPGEALILGAREDFGSPPKQAELLKWEDKLRAEILAPNGADEIIALLAPKAYLKTTTSALAASWHTQNHLVLRVRQGQAELAWYKDDGRYEYRRLEPTELRDLRALLDEQHIEDLPPHITNPGPGQTEYEFLRLTKQGGRRVYIVNPEKSAVDADPCLDLLRQFRSFTEDREFKARYDIQARVNGMEIVMADSQSVITSVCGAGNKTAVFVNYMTNEALRPEQLDAISHQAGWYEIISGKVGNKVEAPKSCGFSGYSTTTADAAGRTVIIFNSFSDRAVPNYVVVMGTQPGIMRFPNLREVEPIVVGNFQDALETPDNKWLLAVKGGRTEPKSLVRIDLTTRQQYPTKLTLTGTATVLRFLRTHNQFLLRHDLGNGQVQHYFIDPTNGEATPANGDFRPLPHRTQRELQLTSTPDEAWAIVYNEKTKARDIGRYNLKTFTFIPLTAIPELSFSSGEMWIDEPARAIYIAYRGHLLRFPLSQ